MLVLAIETSSELCSVAVGNAGGVMAQTTLDQPRQHSRRLIRSIEGILKDAGKDLSDVDVFAASQGPGSFTGIRLGVTAAKTLAYATSAKTIGVCSLEAIAQRAFRHGLPGPYIVNVDARQGEFYCALFCEENGELVTQQAAQIIAAADCESTPWLQGDPLNGTGEHAAQAEDVLGVALRQLAHQAPDDDAVFTLIPQYLKASAPERKLAHGQS